MATMQGIRLGLSFFLIGLGLVSLFSCAAHAQTPSNIQSEILAVRSRIAAAAEANDIETLERLFTSDFTHTHAVGRVDNLTVRISAMIGGEVTIELAKPDDISIRAYGTDTAIAIGQTTITPAVYRWTTVYVKSNGTWKAAASHASPVAAK